MGDWKNPNHHERFLPQRERMPGNFSHSGSLERSAPDQERPLIKFNGNTQHFSSQEEGKVGGEGQKHNQSSAKENRICKVCKRGFASGRALGGHMRVHTQSPTQVQEVKWQAKSQVQPQDILLTSNTPTTYNDTKVTLNLLTSNTPTTNTAKIIPTHHHQHGNYKISGISASHFAPDRSMKMKTIIEDGDSGGNPICSLCGKMFQSVKSLRSHMRCHPDRHWRGIQPPAPIAVQAATSLEKKTYVYSTSTLSDKDLRELNLTDDQMGSFLFTSTLVALNLEESLPTWSITGKRGREPIHAAISPHFVSASEEQQAISALDAAYTLMMLSHGNCMGCFSKRRRREDDESQSQVAGVQCLECLPKPIAEKLSIALTSREKVKEEVESISSCSDHSSQVRGQPAQSNQISCTFEKVLDEKSKNLKREKKKMKLGDLERVAEMGPIDYQQQQQPSTMVATGFKCSACNKSFTSYQALGGHKSRRSCQIREVEELELQLLSNSTHRCKICNKAFQTGQALGGHQRCHRRRPAQAAPSSSVASLQYMSKIGSKVLDIDLNKIPEATIKDDDEVL